MKFPISCVLVEDEQLQMQILERELLAFDLLEVIGTAHTLDEAYQLLLQQAPRTAIMDVRFTGGTIYDLFERLKEAGIPIPVTILVSAHEVEAIAAFNSYRDEVAYFILKRDLDIYLRPAIDRMLGMLQQKEQEEGPGPRPGSVLLRSQGYVARIDLSEIAFAKVLPNGRSCLITDKDLYELNSTLVRLIEIYPAIQLIRVNQQVAVAKRKVEGVNTRERMIDILYQGKTMTFSIGPEYYGALMLQLGE